MFMANLWSQLGRVCCQVKELFLRRVWVGKLNVRELQRCPGNAIAWVPRNCVSVTVDMRPPTLDDHNFLIRAPL